MMDALRKPPGTHISRIHSWKLAVYTCHSAQVVTSVVVLGPPGSGVSVVSSLISRRLGSQYISVPYLVQQAISKGTTLGLQAKPYVDKGKPVPDLIVMALLNTAMADPDTKERGYVLEGFPQNREQALTLARRGILPNHLVVFDVPDHVLLSSAGVPPTLRHNLAEYRRNLPNVMSLFPSVSRKWTFEEGLGRMVEDAAQAALTFLASTPVSKAPRGMKLILASFPGNVAEDVGELCAERYGCVLVSPRVVILEQISANTPSADIVKRSVNAPHEAPTDVIAQLIGKRLKQPDCIEHGWILANFPTNMVELEAFKKQGVTPSRLIWLDSPPMTCLSRMTIQTGDSTLSRTRLAAAVRLQDELGALYGIKRKAFDVGLLQTVDASDVGMDEENGTDDRSVVRIFERVVDALQRDVPIATT
ncbi:adenylate kinase [Synchytrium endobioticum]|uniref:Adenylate kinase n=1 Tax=Synchytrium endobioticum TaxID=286115 RepID=A0A507BN87_9FUNG|nr:adenylate kinase [Synchytrium endobioticum]